VSAIVGTTARDAVQRQLWRTDPAGKRLPHLSYLIDAAHDPDISRHLAEDLRAGSAVSLYEGAGAEELADVAPYLVSLGTDERMFAWIWERGWGRNWGVFLWSAAPLLALRQHFRRLTRVRTEDGRTFLFRFYDPRVLSVFLPSCDAAQADEMFGPVECFYAEAEEGTELNAFARADGRVVKTSLRLGGGAQA
jgi:hypothetical protein